MSTEFLDACARKRVETTPVWFMRQAGRSLPGYRKLRKKYDVLTIAQTPELAAQVTIEPIQRLGVDAAILFADIMLLPISLGVKLKIVDSVGPMLDSPLDTPKKLARMRVFEPERLDYLASSIKLLRNELEVPLIGFSGAPFTLASYIIEGKPSRTWTKTKQFMLREPKAWDEFMHSLTDAIVGYLKLQVDAGVQAVQIFDSWVGGLTPHMYHAQVHPHMRRLFEGLKDMDVPRIHFGTNTVGIFNDFVNVDCEVIGVDWHQELSAAKQLAKGKALQGNLDPAVLLADWPTIKRETDRILKQIDPKKGFIFNLGHGILPETDDRMVRKLVEYIHV